MAERLVFIEPNDNLDIELTLNQNDYGPGDKVEYTVQVTEKSTGKKSKHDILISLLATDTSPFIEMDTKKLPASIPAQVYLSKDIKPTKDYEFLYARDYLDSIYTGQNNPNM